MGQVCIRLLLTAGRESGWKFIGTIEDHHHRFGVIGFLEWSAASHQHEQNHAQTPNICSETPKSVDDSLVSELTDCGRVVRVAEQYLGRGIGQ